MNCYHSGTLHQHFQRAGRPFLLLLLLSSPHVEFIHTAAFGQQAANFKECEIGCLDLTPSSLVTHTHSHTHAVSSGQFLFYSTPNVCSIADIVSMESSYSGCVNFIISTHQWFQTFLHTLFAVCAFITARLSFSVLT